MTQLKKEQQTTKNEVICKLHHLWTIENLFLTPSVNNTQRNSRRNSPMSQLRHPSVYLIYLESRANWKQGSKSVRVTNRRTSSIILHSEKQKQDALKIAKVSLSNAIDYCSTELKHLKTKANNVQKRFEYTNKSLKVVCFTPFCKKSVLDVEGNPFHNKKAADGNDRRDASPLGTISFLVPFVILSLVVYRRYA